MSDPLEMLMIGVGRHSYALPLQDVRHIIALQPDFCFAGEGAERYLAYQGAPLPFVSSWDQTGDRSAYQDYAELNAMLPQRRQDHIDWMASLESAIRQGHAFSKARSPFECAFGKWYYSYRPSNRQLSLLLKSFDQPHARIHALADQLLGLVETGRQQEALARFQQASDTVLKELLNLFNEAENLTVSLQRRVAILLHHGETLCALGADEVRDITTVPAERVTTSSMMHATDEVAPTLVILDDGLVVPVMDWKRWVADWQSTRRP